MNKLDDLYTLARLLKEFEFPVSPILEYAIKEKEGELRAESTVVVKDDSDIIEQPENDVMNELISFSSLKEEFSYYLYKSKKVQTARNYLRYIDKPIREYINKVVGSEVESVYDCKTVADVRALSLKLKTNESFIADNLKLHNGLTAAISSYLKFLEIKENSQY